ncbi:MAG TPA: phosphoribosyltransferase family protein [Desulfotignum sp.]|nr:phosphoribosyltransferase family protein [Desulfotignum sp.]
MFTDRFDAGRAVADMLAHSYKSLPGLMVLGIPMGGIPLASEVSKKLACPMDVVIVRKIQVPGNTESGFGAMTEENDIFYNKVLISGLRLNEKQIQEQSDKVSEELAQRREKLRQGRHFPDIQGKTVILVDDGLASGFTMKASIHLCKKRKAAKTIVAVPTAPLHTVQELHDLFSADIFCANIREGMAFAVADAYKNWHDLSENEIMHLLE